MTKDEALRLALEAMNLANSSHNTMLLSDPPQSAWRYHNVDMKLREAIIAIKAALEAKDEQQLANEPVAVDQATMELAESVGLIGPASRTHDLHDAIQRFYDLICANATIKAAVAFSRTLEAKDEPVAFYHPRSGFYWAKPTSIFAPTSVDVERLPLYTAAERNNG